MSGSSPLKKRILYSVGQPEPGLAQEAGAGLPVRGEAVPAIPGLYIFQNFKSIDWGL